METTNWDLANDIARLHNEVYESFNSLIEKINNIHHMGAIIIVLLILTISLNIILFCCTLRQINKQRKEMLKIQEQNLVLQNIIITKIQEKQNDI